LSYTYSEKTLENGLRIVAEHSPNAATAAVGFFVKTGARDEETSLMGVSHFLEHMMFKGTEQLSAEGVDLAFDSLGAEHNAFTSSEMTAFWGAGLPEVLGDIQGILADILRPALRQQDFDAEKKVILEEIAMYDDQPFWVLYENAMEEYYGKSSLGHRVLGTPETIQNMQRDALANYFVERYSADNTIVSIAGALDFEREVERIEQLCGQWKRTDTSRVYDEINRNKGTFTKNIEQLNQQYILLMMPSASFQDEHRHATAALASILGGGDGSRLHWAIVDSGLAETASASADPSDRFGEQYALAVCDPQNAEEVIDHIRNEMKTLVSSLTQEDLTKVIAKAGTAAAVSSERPAGRMQRLGSTMTTSGTYCSVEEELQTIEQLTLKDLQNAAERFPWEPIFEATTLHSA